jgi:3-deoxy-D-manno-octulosonic-acid transferase
MVFGPNMQNFEAIARAFVERNGAMQVKDAASLEEALALLLANGDKAAEIGRNAQQSCGKTSARLSEPWT